MSQEQAISQATLRKRRQRQSEAEKYAAMDIKTVSVQLSSNERKQLEEVRHFHGGYDVNECVATLIRRAYQTMQETKANIEPCQFCGEIWPNTCDKKFKGRGECFLTHKKRELAL
ncbi:hypothetical protein ACPUEK_08365 [Marinomonas gallaica]|uniref:hypothetical protein n=1 Tax=Marinomonas gallaica TaxID=1806667 RepID=UPI003CE4A63D